MASPCLIIGTVDAKHSFKLLGFTISMIMKEDEAAFTEEFQSVKDALKTFFQFEWSPMYAMADSAGAIHNALVACFPQI